MSKWRPVPNSIFILPDLHGRIEELELILDRILPLRNNKNSKDKLILLGDYIDRGKNSASVVDKLISLRQKYKDQVVLLRGNHEQMLLSSSSGRAGSLVDIRKPSPYAMWVCNGGDQTIIQYAARKGIKLYDGRHLSQEKAISYIEKEHIDFIEKETILYYELDNYIFVHAGCDPIKPLQDQNEDILLWDRSLFKFVIRFIRQGKELPWEKTIVVGHSYLGPIINSKYMMLDCSASNKLLVVELNSMEAFAAYEGNGRLVREKLIETQPNNPLFQHVDN